MLISSRLFIINEADLNPVYAMRVTTALAVVLPIAHAANSSSPIDTNPLQPTPIRGVKKMTDDEGEKFFFNYWDFGHEGWSTGDDNLTDSRHDPGMQGRSYPLRSSLALELDPFSLRFRRDFKCPTGTFGCTSINRPDSCCSFGDTCELVQDTGSGDVGCCPQGQVCSGTIGSCQKDYTSCPASLGGGCCIPGYDCVSGGCECPILSHFSLGDTHANFSRRTRSYDHCDPEFNRDGVDYHRYGSLGTKHAFEYQKYHSHRVNRYICSPRTTYRPLDCHNHPENHNQPNRISLSDGVLCLFCRV